MYNQLFSYYLCLYMQCFFLFVLTCTCMLGFSVNHRIVYLYVWFVSMCLCCIRPNKSYVVVVDIHLSALCTRHTQTCVCYKCVKITFMQLNVKGAKPCRIHMQLLDSWVFCRTISKSCNTVIVCKASHKVEIRHNVNCL